MKRDPIEVLFRSVLSVRYLFFAVKWILVASLLALFPVYLLGYPLWYAVIIGVLMFLVYRLIFRSLLQLLFKGIDWLNRQ